MPYQAALVKEKMPNKLAGCTDASRLDLAHSVHDRLCYVLNLMGISQDARAARELGIPRSTFQGVMDRDRIRHDTAEKIAAKTGLSSTWLLSGKGSIETELRALRTRGLIRESPQTPSSSWLEARTPKATVSYDLKGSVRSRLHFLQETMGFESLEGFARATGITQEVLVGILERDSIEPDQAAAIAKSLWIDSHWLLTGMGQMEKRGSEIQGYVGWPAEAIGETPMTELARADVSDGEDRDIVWVKKAADRLSAGGGIIAEDQMLPERYAFRRDWLKRVSTSPNNVIMLDVDGDSMQGKQRDSLYNGDSVLVDRGRTEVVREGIFAINLGGVALVKRLQPLPGGMIQVLSDHPAYQDYPVPADELRIIGQVIWFARTYV